MQSIALIAPGYIEEMFFWTGLKWKDSMAEKLNNKEMVTFEELLVSNTITQEALINLLDEKGII